MKKITFGFVMLFLFLLVGCTKSYTVTFVTNSSETLENEVVENKAFLELPTVTKEGHNFGGWFIDAEFNTPFSVKNPIESNLTLYAKWNIKKFTVTFYNDDDSVIEAKEDISYGTAATAPADPVKEGYSFVGWDKSFAEVKENLSVKAQFDILTYTVTFFNGANQPIGTPQTVNHGAAATAPANPTKAGYSFLEWDKSFSSVKSNLEIHPVFERLQYTVEFQDSDGTRIGEVQNIFHGEGATAPSSPSKNGYTFGGWDITFTNVTENKIVKAVYIIDEFDINYYDESTKLTHQPDTYTIDSGFNLVEFVKAGFYFVGWYEDSAFTTKVESITPGNTGAITLYGKWLDQSQTFSLNYELNGGGWTWNRDTVAVPGNGIDAYSNLPEQLMADFYYYLKQNNLLTSPLVASKLQKTTWATFKANYTDPVAIYNHTSTNTSSMNDGYSQFFYSTATGDTATHQVLTLTGGFFGTEPYKTKY
ncbi:MAG: InlB B-repeat-containing protein, partial [Bacilli bacterium]|nr:InlB B-repeat-containing protein [Bacilli bacterium]